MIVRSAPTQNYTVVKNSVLQNKSLTYQATGLLCILLSKPPHWQTNIRQLAAESVHGKDFVQSALKELEATGYLVRRRIRTESGTFMWVAMVYDEPQPASVEDDTMSGLTGHGQSAQVDGSSHEKTMSGLTMSGQTVSGQTVSGQTVSGEPGHIVSTIRESTNTTNPPVISSPPDGSEGTRQAVGANPPTAKPKPKSKPGKRQMEPPAQPPATPAVPPEPPTEHQQFFEAVCKAVGWDYKTLTADQQGQVAQTVGVLAAAGYGIAELRRFWKEVWVTDWRWRKFKQHPTIPQLRSEIGKVKVKELGSDERSTDGSNDELRQQLREKRRAAKERREGLAAGANPG